MLEPERSLANKQLEIDTRNAFFKAFGLDPLRNDPIQDVIADAQAEEEVAAEEVDAEFEEPEFEEREAPQAKDDNIFQEYDSQPIFVSAGFDFNGKQNDRVSRDTADFPQAKVAVDSPTQPQPPEVVKQEEVKEPSPEAPILDEQKTQTKEETSLDPGTTEQTTKPAQDKPINFGKESPVIPQGPDQHRFQRQQPTQPGKNAPGPQAPNFVPLSMPWLARNPGMYSVHPVDNSITMQPATNDRDTALMADQLADTSESTTMLLSSAISRIIDALLYLNSEIEKHNEILDRSFGG